MNHNLQLFSSLIVLFLALISCKNEKPSPPKAYANEQIIIQLEERIGKSDFQIPAEVLFPLEAIPQFKNIPSEFTEYVIRNYIFLKEQHLYMQYKQGVFEEEEYKILKNVYQIKHENTTNEAVTTEVFILIGTLQNGKRGVVVDANLNFNFSDDELLEFEYPMIYIDEEDEAFFEQNKLDFLPKIKLSLPHITHQKVETKTYNIVVNPHRPFDRFYVSRDPLENKYYLEFLFPTFYEATTTLSNEAYILQIGPSTNLASLSKDNTELVVLARDKKKDNEFSELLRLQLTDTFNLQQKDYMLNVSKFDKEKKINLVYLGENKQPQGGLIGYYATLPENVPFLKEPEYIKTAEQYNYNLYYVWTTWNLASLQEVASLKQMQEEFPNINLIGVCVDENLGAAERMQFRRGMQWKSAFISPNQPDNWATKMRILTFPTYLLVDENGQIKERTHHLKEITNYLLSNEKPNEVE